MFRYPSHALCILEAVGRPEKYDAFLDGLIEAVDESKSSQQQIRALVQLASDFPERSFQPVSNGFYLDKPMLGKGTERVLFEMPSLNHMCCGLGYSEQDGKIKVNIVRGMECVVFSPQHNAFLMVTVNDGLFERSSNAEGYAYFLKTSEQGFMKPFEAVAFFERQRKLAQSTGSVIAKRPLNTTIPSFANREFRIGG